MTDREFFFLFHIIVFQFIDMVYLPPPRESKIRWKILFTNALTRPFQLFAQESIIQILGIYMAFLYGLFYGQSFS